MHIHDPQETLDQAVDRASEITWWNRQMTKLNRMDGLENALDFAESELVERKGPYVELVEAPERADIPTAEFFRELGYEEGVIEAAVEGLFDGDETGRLYKHQVETVRSIEEDSDDTILSVPTAAGKTESFFFPMLNHCLSTDEEGLKSLVIYPMKTLSVDQMNRFLTYLYHVNRGRPPQDRVTIGIWDGDTPSSVGSRDHEIETDSYIRGLECPDTQDKLRIISNNTVGTDETKYSWIKVTRENIKNGVDILLTNPEALDHMFVSNSDETLGILGSKPSEQPVEHIVYDEAHVWSGVSGASISLLTKRLKNFYSDRDPQVTMVSATVDNPAELASSLTHTPEEDISAVGFTSRDIPTQNTTEFTRFQPCTIPEIVEVIGRASLLDTSKSELVKEYSGLGAALDMLGDIGVVNTGSGLSISDEHSDWVSRPVERTVDRLLSKSEYDTPSDVLDSEEGVRKSVNRMLESGVATNRWFDLVTERMPEVAEFASWFNTDTTGSVGFKKKSELIDEISSRGAEDPDEVLDTVLVFGRLAGIVTEKYHSFLKPPNKIHWCRDCRIVSRTSSCQECGGGTSELQFCKRCHYPYFEIGAGEDKEDKDKEFSPVGLSDPKPVERCPGCDNSVNLSDIGVPTPTLLSFMLTEICRTVPSDKTLVFSDSHASAESVATEIINTEYSLMAQSLYLKGLLENNGVHDNYKLFQDVSEQLREAYYKPLFQNEVDEDSETYNMLRQMRSEISNNAYLSSCRFLLQNSLVMPEILYQDTADDVDRRIIGQELYSLFAENPDIGFGHNTVSLEGLTREKICDRISNRTTYSSDQVEQHIDGLIAALLEDRVIVEQDWENLQHPIAEKSIAEERKDSIVNYLEEQKQELSKADVFDQNFDTGVLTRIPKRDRSDLRLIPRVYYCRECFTSHPVPEDASVETCRGCGSEVKTYDRFDIQSDGSYKGQGYANVESEWKWPMDHWAYEINRPLNSDSTPEFVTVGVHKGNIPPTLRGSIEEAFRKGNPEVNVVSATPTMELGVDIGTLDTVTQVGIPPTLTNYVQRSGRTGRKRGSSSLVMTVVRGEHPVDNHYYANLEGFFRDFEPVRVPDPFEFDEVLAGHVMTFVVSYLARNPHESNVFNKIYVLEESNTNLDSYVEKVTRKLGILRDFIVDEVEDELRPRIHDVFGEEGLEVFDELFHNDGNLSLSHRTDVTFRQLTSMSTSGETNKRLSESYSRLDRWLSLLGYLANYRDFGQRFPVKMSGRQESVEFETQGRLYDMFPGEENDLGSVIKLHGSQYVVSDVHGTNSPIEEVRICNNEDCDMPFQAHEKEVDACPYCEAELEQTDVHGVASVECRTTRGGEEGYNTRGMMSTNISHTEGGDDPVQQEITLFGINCEVEYSEYRVTDLVYAFERGHSRGSGRETLRSEAFIENKETDGEDDQSGGSWEDRLEDVTEETYAPVGQQYHTRGINISMPREALERRLKESAPENSSWPQALASLEQALKKAVAVIGQFDLQDFRVKTNLTSETVEITIVDSREGGNGVTWQVKREIDEELPERVSEVASCDRCADYCEECLLLSRTNPSYLENNLLNKHTLKSIIGAASADMEGADIE